MSLLPCTHVTLRTRVSTVEATKLLAKHCDQRGSLNTKQFNEAFIGSISGNSFRLMFASKMRTNPIVIRGAIYGESDGTVIDLYLYRAPFRMLIAFAWVGMLVFMLKQALYGAAHLQMTSVMLLGSVGMVFFTALINYGRENQTKLILEHLREIWSAEAPGPQS